jgi:hypothetical protein
MVPLHIQLVSSTLRKVIKRLHYPLEVMLVCVRWYAAYPLSLRNLEEMMAERGVIVDHATVHRWALKMLPVLASVVSQPQAIGRVLLARRSARRGHVAVAVSRKSTVWPSRSTARYRYFHCPPTRM